MIPKAHIESYGRSLFLIKLPVARTGFDGFTGAWVYTGGPTVVVDVGPGSASAALLAALAELSISRLDYIMLTHIHIDHCGGIGAVARAFDPAPVVCHPKAISHLVDPQRLWQGSLKTLGDTALAYGPIEPVEAHRIVPADQIDIDHLTAVATPGHAAHHYSYLIGDLLFAGEAGGVCLSFDDGQFYLRPATPPRFFLKTNLDSIDRLLHVRPRIICYGHIGSRENAGSMLRLHRDQLLRWRLMIQSFQEKAPVDDDAAISACCDYLLQNDPLLAGFSRLAPDVQQRERGFLINSIKGFWGYLASGEAVS